MSGDEIRTSRLAELLRKPTFGDQARSFAQGASNAVASNLSGPVDGLAWLLRKVGVPVPTPVGGSEWLAQKGLTAEPQNKLAGLLGEGAGLAAPILMANKAPQIAGGLLALDDHAMNMGRKAIEKHMVDNGMIQPATVWHGSPHKFDKFDSSKIGTGEGAQAYGHGLYLAENPAVAKEYKEALGAGRGNTDADTMARILEVTGGNPKKAAEVARQRAQYANIPGGKEKFEAIAAKLESGYDPRGSLYKVDLPDNAIAKMLDWDKPLSQQPGVMESLQRGMTAGTPAEITGEQLYRQLGAMNKAGAAEILRNKGIPGIRYLDGGSRGAGSGTSNYVIFPKNEGLLTILERNGVPIK